jgi:organic radical activating enzyme
MEYFRNWEKQSLNNIIKKIEKLSDKTIGNFIITGGEPLLQLEGIKPLINVLKNEFSSIEIETNGTISGKILFDNSVYFNVSVKLSNSGEKRGKRIIPAIIKEFNDYNKAIFKFVVKDEKDVNEVIEIQSDYNIKNEKIYLMPMAETKPELDKIADNILKLALSNKFNFSDRLQLRYNIK